MIDLHSHVLWGIDDGPDTIEGSVALARAAVAAGTRTLVATPHVSPRYPNDAATIARLADELRARLAAEEVALELLAGAEIALTRLADVEPVQLAQMGLGGGPWLLIECPFAPAVGGLEAILSELRRRGRRILLAHPERCPTFQRDPQMLARLVEGGILTSITAGSLVGDFGERVRRFALELVHRDLVHNVASDAHDTVRRPPGIADRLERAGLGPLADWLTREVPAAIVSGGEIPPGPAVVLPDLIAGGSPQRSRRRFGRVS
jgi:protein-tyrosine phosphatase